MQNTSHILMIRPVQFAFNAQTAVDNAFQQNNDAATGVQQKALEEFDAFVQLLRENDVQVTVVDDTAMPATPDSIFPNNWFSTHRNGTLVLYPMCAPNRRDERKPHLVKMLKQKLHLNQEFDLSSYEEENLFLEGTGSMVLDREHKVAYAGISPRTSEELLQRFCQKMNYTPVSFTAVDENGRAIYHTNVMMCVADRYAVVCLECVPDRTERQGLETSLANTGKEIIEITYGQLNQFAGNMLQVVSMHGEKLLVMSSAAFHSLDEKQVERLLSYNKIIHTSLSTIETNGGGSARCMMGELFSAVS